MRLEAALAEALPEGGAQFEKIGIVAAFVARHLYHAPFRQALFFWGTPEAKIYCNAHNGKKVSCFVVVVVMDFMSQISS